MVRTDRDFIKVLLLSIITCGIYGIIFYYNYVEDVNVVCRRDGKNTTNYIVAILLSLITCGIYSFVWFYKLGERLDENGRAYNVNVDINGTSMLLWMILGSFIVIGPYVAMYKMINALNKLSEAYNNANA